MTFFDSVKKRVNSTSCKMALCASAALAVVAPGYCADDELQANNTISNVINMMFNLITIAGIVLLAMGVVQLVRAIIALTGGDQLQPGQLGKALGFIIAGIVAVSLKAILGALGVDVSTITII